MKKVVIIVIAIIGIIGVACVTYFGLQWKEEKEIAAYVAQLDQDFKLLYQDEDCKIPKEDLTEEEVDEVIEKIEENKYSINKEKQLEQLKELKQYLSFKQELNDFFEEEVLKADVSNEQLETLQKEVEKLPENLQELLDEKMNLALEQKKKIDEAVASLEQLFVSKEMKQVKEKVTRKELETAKNKMKELPQKELWTKYQEKYTTVENFIKDREEKEREEREERKERKAELERQRQIELERQRKLEEEERRKEEERQKIQNAYVEIKNVPYINQKYNKVYNGCEAACLLMSLQYRGLATNHNLTSFATIMPKHESNPHLGFIHSIFDLEPRDVTHWIAPDALSSFGSQFGNVKNVSGSTAGQIRSYIDQNIPVIVYVTTNFQSPTKWYGEVPLNLHVVLVTGYNKITGDYIISDPWSGRMVVSKNTFESIYNLLRYAVIVQ